MSWIHVRVRSVRVASRVFPHMWRMVLQQGVGCSRCQVAELQQCHTSKEQKPVLYSFCKGMRFLGGLLRFPAHQA